MMPREIITVIIQTKDFKEKIPEKENIKLSLCVVFYNMLLNYFTITCFKNFFKKHFYNMLLKHDMVHIIIFAF